MGEPESDSGHHEHAVIGDVGGISSPNAGDTMKEGQPQLDSTHEQQLEHYEADDITRMHLEPTGSMGEAENGNLAAVETAQHPPHDDQHATQGSAAMHVDDGKEEGSELPAEVINHENHPASQDSQEQGHSSATWLSTAADSASSQDTLQPVSEETSLHRKPTPDEGHHLSYNGGSSVADSMQHTAAVPDQTHDEPVASGVAKSKQAQQPKAEDSQAMPEDQAKYLQEEDAREGEVVDQEPTSTPADTNTAIPGGMRPIPSCRDWCHTVMRHIHHKSCFECAISSGHMSVVMGYIDVVLRLSELRVFVSCLAFSSCIQILRTANSFGL